MINALELYRQIKDQWDTTSQPLKERGIPGQEFNPNGGLSAYLSPYAIADTFAPVGTYEDGRMGPALPKALTDLPPFSEFVTGIPGAAYDMVAGLAGSTKRLMDSDLANTPVNDDAAWSQMGRDSFDAAGLAMTGGLGVGLAGGLADNALGSAGAKLTGNALERSASDLPMDLASRMARAKEMGFDTDRTWYHGTRYDFDEFKPSNRGAMGPGVYLGDQSTASQYTNRGNGISYGDSTGDRVLPVMVRGNFAPDQMLNEATKKHFVGDRFHSEAQRMAADDLLAQGYAGILDNKNSIATVFDPRNIRSTSAAFDPAKSDSANLLYSNAPTGSSVPLAIQAMERAGVEPRNALSVNRINPDTLEISPDPYLNKIWKNTVIIDRILDGTDHTYMPAIVNEAGDFPLEAYDIGGLSNAWRKKVKTTGELFSNAPTGSVVPAGMQASPQETDPALIEYLRLTGQIPY